MEKLTAKEIADDVQQTFDDVTDSYRQLLEDRIESYSDIKIRLSLIIHLSENHPYPNDVFIPPTKDQWEDFHRILKKGGYDSGGFVGHCCRIGYGACIWQIKNYTE